MYLNNTLPEERRGKLKALLATEKRPIRILEAHNGLSAVIANDTLITMPDGSTKGFDGIWISGLTETASRGLPDIELQGMMARLALIREIAIVSNKAIVVDGDTGGTIDQLQYTIRTLEGLGVSALIIEDKVFPKNNSLNVDKPQTLEDPDFFAHKIAQGKQSQHSSDFMLIARIEALVAGKGTEEALRRAEKYLRAGADGIVIHSRAKTADEVLEFTKGYRKICQELGVDIPLVSIPTTYNSITEEELYQAGFKLIIHANYLLRSAYVAMKDTAESILKHDRSLEVEDICCSVTTLFKSVEQAKDATTKA